MLYLLLESDIRYVGSPPPTIVAGNHRSKGHSLGTDDELWSPKVFSKYNLGLFLGLKLVHCVYDDNIILSAYYIHFLNNYLIEVV